jgi:putative membrane protein
MPGRGRAGYSAIPPRTGVPPTMDYASSLPAFGAVLNGTNAGLLITAIAAIWRGERVLHRRLMLANLAVSLLFLVVYVIQTVLLGHTRFPGDDWVRSLFLGILGTHIFLAVCLVPLVLRTVYLAVKERFEEHRRIARVTFPVWLYVSLTGVVIYWMNQHLRPPV